MAGRSAILVAVGAALASCLVSSVEVIDQPLGSGGSPPSSSTGQAGAAGAKPCNHARWPGPPASDDPAADDIDFVAAVHSVDIGDGDPNLSTVGPKVGWDLDATCTCGGDGPSCVEPKGVTQDRYCDGPGGIDNNVARLFHEAGAFTDRLSSGYFSSGANKGAWTLLVRVKNYNGKPNDTQVTVSLYPSPGLHLNNSCVAMADGPKWDGTDAWPVDVISLDKGAGAGADGGACAVMPITGYSFDNPRYTDPNAYVAGGVLVANLPSSQIELGGSTPPVQLKLTAAFITGQIVSGPSGFKLTKGILAGRWAMPDIFAALSELNFGGKALCKDNSFYAPVKNAMCGSRDILSTVQGPTTPCDAVSLALGFETDPAKLGVVAQLGTTGSPCAAGQDPATDSCN